MNRQSPAVVLALLLLSQLGLMAVKTDKMTSPEEQSSATPAKKENGALQTIVDTAKTDTSSQPQKVSTAVQAPKQAVKKRKISVKNKITDAMQRYSHWSGTYSPSTLRIKVNNKWIEPGQKISLEIKDNTIQILYIFQFTVGNIVYHDNAQLITYKINPDAETITLTIKWGEKPTSLQVSDAQRVDIIHDYGKK